jgi:hypothetical protein
MIMARRGQASFAGAFYHVVARLSGWINEPTEELAEGRKRVFI